MNTIEQLTAWLREERASNDDLRRELCSLRDELDHLVQVHDKETRGLRAQIKDLEARS